MPDRKPTAIADDGDEPRGLDAVPVHRPHPVPKPPPGVSAGRRKKGAAAPPPIHPLTIARCELTFPDGTLLQAARVVILRGQARALDRRSRVLWQSPIAGWSRSSGIIEIRVSQRETVRVRQTR